jgi:hypothetical protein
VRAIDDAVRRGEFALALQKLDEHDAKFGRGHFTEECAAARVMATCGAHSTESARQGACAFFSRYPNSPMRARIEGACSVHVTDSPSSGQVPSCTAVSSSPPSP